MFGAFLIDLSKAFDWLLYMYYWLSCLRIAVCYYHIMYPFQSESTPYGCLNVKELFAQNRYNIDWVASLSSSNGIETRKGLICEQTRNHLAKPACWLIGWVFVYVLSGCGYESLNVHMRFWYASLRINKQLPQLQKTSSKD